MTVDPDSDPGRNWRRLACVGALLATSSIYFTSSFRWQYYEHLFQLAYKVGNLGVPWRVRVIWCLFITTSIIGPCMLPVCSRKILRPGHRIVQCAPLIVLWVLTVFPPFLFGIRQLSSATVAKSELLPGLMCLFAYISMGGITFLYALKHKHGVLFPFWFGFLPLVTFVLRNAINLSLELTNTTFLPQTAASKYVDFSRHFGGLMMLVGWILWWRAVKIVNQGRSTVYRVQPE